MTIPIRNTYLVDENSVPFDFKNESTGKIISKFGHLFPEMLDKGSYIDIYYTAKNKMQYDIVTDNEDLRLRFDKLEADF